MLPFDETPSISFCTRSQTHSHHRVTSAYNCATHRRYERENQEVAGDDDGQEEEDTGMGGPDDETDAAADAAEQQAAASLGDGIDEATE